MTLDDTWTLCCFSKWNNIGLKRTKINSLKWTLCSLMGFKAMWKISQNDSMDQNAVMNIQLINYALSNSFNLFVRELNHFENNDRCKNRWNDWRKFQYDWIQFQFELNWKKYSDTTRGQQNLMVASSKTVTVYSYLTFVVYQICLLPFVYQIDCHPSKDMFTTLFSIVLFVQNANHLINLR